MSFESDFRRKMPEIGEPPHPYVVLARKSVARVAVVMLCLSCAALIVAIVADVFVMPSKNSRINEKLRDQNKIIAEQRREMALFRSIKLSGQGVSYLYVGTGVSMAHYKAGGYKTKTGGGFWK